MKVLCLVFVVVVALAALLGSARAMPDPYPLADPDPSPLADPHGGWGGWGGYGGGRFRGGGGGSRRGRGGSRGGDRGYGGRGRHW